MQDKICCKACHKVGVFTNFPNTAFCSAYCQRYYKPNEIRDSIWKNLNKRLLGINSKPSRHSGEERPEDSRALRSREPNGERPITSEIKSKSEHMPGVNLQPDTPETEPKKTNNDTNDLSDKGKILSLPKPTDNITRNGMNETRQPIRNVPISIDELEILSPESKQQLTLVKEVTSQQMILLDESAKLLFERMKDLNKSTESQGPGVLQIEQTINIAKTINELMKTKREALKTTADIIQTIRS